jgi:hypothetical protein
MDKTKSRILRALPPAYLVLPEMDHLRYLHAELESLTHLHAVTNFAECNRIPEANFHQRATLHPHRSLKFHSASGYIGQLSGISLCKKWIQALKGYRLVGLVARLFPHLIIEGCPEWSHF